MKKNMYNRAIKSKFLDQTIKSKKTNYEYINQFDFIYDLEYTLNQDVAYIDNETFFNYLQEKSISVVGATYYKLFNHLNTYRDWYNDNVYVCNTNKLLVENMKCKGIIERNIVASPGHLIEILDEHDALDSGNNGTMCILLTYIGIPMSEMGKLLETSVDLKRMKIKFDGRSYPIYTEFKDFFDRYVNTTTRTVKASSRRASTKDATINIQKLDVPYFLKKYSGAICDVGYRDYMTSNTLAYHVKSLINEDLDSAPYLALKSVRAAGNFYRIYKQTLKGVDINYAIKSGFKIKNNNRKKLTTESKTYLRFYIAFRELYWWEEYRDIMKRKREFKKRFKYRKRY